MASHDPDRVYAEYIRELALRLWRVFPPILLVVGTLGNGMSIAVLSRQAIRRSNAAIYLIVLSVVDILVLYTGLLRQWLRYYFNTDVRHFGNASCKIHTWVVYVTLDLSVWVLVALTFERLVSVYLPHRVKKHCTAMTSFISLGVISVVLLAVNSHFLYGLGDLVKHVGRNRTVTRHCTHLFEEYIHFGTKIWPWIDLCLYSLVPLSIIIVCNIAIVVKVLLSRRRARRVHPSSTVTFQINGGQAHDSRSKKISSMTAMLVVLNMVLLITTMPVSAYLIVEPYIFVPGVTFKTVTEMSLAWAVVNMLQYTNNSINFLLYCLSGSRFREELCAMFRRNRRLTPANITNSQQPDVPLSRFGSLRRSRRGRPSLPDYPQSNTTQMTNASSCPVNLTQPSPGTLQLPVWAGQNETEDSHPGRQSPPPVSVTPQQQQQDHHGDDDHKHVQDNSADTDLPTRKEAEGIQQEISQGTDDLKTPTMPESENDTIATKWQDSDL